MYLFLKNQNLEKKVYKFTKRIKDHIKENVLEDNIFGEFGLDYIGPVDGHDFRELFNALSLAKEMSHSVVVHVHTIKGKGYVLAENDRQAFIMVSHLLIIKKEYIKKSHNL